jgi:hypothetical protein
MTSGSWIKGRANTLCWTPTITPLLLYEYTRDNPERIDDPRWHEGLPEEIVEDIYASLQDLQRLPYYQLMPIRRPTLQRKIQQLREAGVVMLIGTDSGVPLTFHTDSTWREIDYWVGIFGFDVMEAIRAATYWPSLMMGVSDDVGRLAEGKVADIIAVRGDVRWPSTATIAASSSVRSAPRSYSATRVSFRMSTSSSTRVAA